ncbi:MAG: UDP-N-acetylmuramoyl-L-alanyl-D-glutamate--2,6-diaminopimelate ligase [Acidimicrobiia bacterium]
MQFRELLDGVAVLDWVGNPDVDVVAVTQDSRRVEPGTCFVCVPGARVDGHEFAADAVALGAVAVVVDRPLPIDVPQAVVGAPSHAIGSAAARIHGQPSTSMRVFGVTGTNGKTTTTYLMESIIRSAGARSAVIGTTGNRIGDTPCGGSYTTPLAEDLQALFAQMRDAQVDAVAMEVSSHALDQGRVDGTEFTVAAFTNLSHEHLDYHGDMDSYFEAKARLFERGRTAAAAINADDEYGVRLGTRTRLDGVPTLLWSVDEDADVSVRSVEMRADGTDLLLATRAGDIAIQSPLVGRFNVENLAGAAALAVAGGYEADVIARGLSGPIVVPGRVERIERGQPFTVLVDYAHTPDSLANVLAVARELSDARVLVVFGCGGDRDRTKRPMMGAVAGERADSVWVTNDNPRSEDPADIASEVERGLRSTETRCEIVLDRRAAIEAALRAAQPGDVVVIAGKGHETGQTANGVTAPFDDRVVAHELLGAL